MTAILWAALGIVTGSIATVLGDMASQEIRDRLDHLPHAILRLAAGRLEPDQYATVYQAEWIPELEYILSGAETRPITRLITGTRFSLGMVISSGRISRQLQRPQQQPRTQTPTVRDQLREEAWSADEELQRIWQLKQSPDLRRFAPPADSSSAADPWL